MGGAAAGSLAGPGGAALGAGAGYGAGVVLEGSTTDAAVAAIAEKVDGMTPSDIRNLIQATAGEQQGFIDSIVSEIYGLLKLLVLISAFAFVAHFAWTWKRKKRGEEFYAELERLKNKLK